MSDNWKKLQKIASKDKRFQGPFDVVAKKVDNLTEVIKDPDSYNANINILFAFYILANNNFTKIGRGFYEFFQVIVT